MRQHDDFDRTGGMEDMPKKKEAGQQHAARQQQTEPQELQMPIMTRPGIRLHCQMIASDIFFSTLLTEAHTVFFNLAEH